MVKSQVQPVYDPSLQACLSCHFRNSSQEPGIQKGKGKVRVYCLVSSAKRHSPDFIQLPPAHRTCSFISHLNSPGSIQPGCHFFGARNYSNSQSLHCPTRYPLTPGSRECTCEQSALPRSTTSKHIQPGLNTRRTGVMAAKSEQGKV